MDVCPQNLLALVPVSWLAAELEGAEADGAVMLKDETSCIRCGLCAGRCPTQAVTMKRFEFYRECITVPLALAAVR